ncbi:NAD-dependent epimerase/dehydratase family protein [Variovorax terrae]|uniref:NAD-dependent epimerase/dehydratase family protein n=1 Tax=Variovorax terrae TaxID=2923278 RepID=A0A9X1VU38_9BURK|nr:NAD-dependent epimerase/dehydratase family protein [Variovorax terrae]MCJ0761867.1 NAD-dependent epimerase/dehydratase family protein [Variovorax terrae]
MSDAAQNIRALRGPIVVTGASGFVGANLFRKIKSVRNDVYACVRKDKGWRLTDVPDDFIVAIDLNDAAATRNFVQTLQPQTVFDCVAYGAYSFEQDARLIYQTNFQAIVNLVSELSGKPFAAFIHAGSSSEYGTNSAGPAESAACVPNSHYSVSKVAVASYLRYIGKMAGFPCANLRLYSVYGPLEDVSRLVPKMVHEAVEGRFPPLVAPETSRDFVYVDDVCMAFILAAARMNPEIYGEDFNIGSGAKSTIRDLAVLAKDVFNVPVEPVFDSMKGRSWDLSDWYANPAKAAGMLGWKATTPLAEGLRLTADWVGTLSANDMTRHTKQGVKSGRRSITAIIACYRDEPAIPVMHERLVATFKKLGVDYEIIFVNDRSPDNSAEVIRQISERDPHVIGISHSRNFGSQMAFRSGMEIATKDAVVLLDGDLQDPPELIEQFFAQWQEGYDVVYGRRVKREMPWYWGIQYKMFYRVFAAFSYIDIPHDAGDFSLIDRRVVGWLLQFPERDLFMRGLRAYVGFRQTGVDYVRPDRMFGVSTNNFLKNIDWAKKGIFSFSNTPLTMLTSAGVVLLALSTLAAIVIAVLRIIFPDIAPRGATTLLIAILMFGSLNLFAIGIVGEYISKIMTEVKGRPRLIRAAIIRSGVQTDLLPDGKGR